MGQVHVIVFHVRICILPFLRLVLSLSREHITVNMDSQRHERISKRIDGTDHLD